MKKAVEQKRDVVIKIIKEKKHFDHRKAIIFSQHHKWIRDYPIHLHNVHTLQSYPGNPHGPSKPIHRIFFL
ncbi:hypothetical protein RCO48_06110 [Peribacillus frigoritolerans]|nr:hypothetical protein [Peribacillus frigoritolerans]